MASSSRTAGASTSKAPKSPESYESLARRNEATEILQSYEKLSWWSFQRCESLVQTRLHFQNIVAGFTEADEAMLVDWKTDSTPRLKPGEEGKSGRKGKERVSSGGDGVAGSSTQKVDKVRDKSDEGGSAFGGVSKKRKSGSGT